ncbi:MAG TPA: CBS domain-containing protein [Pseudomonadales bacterium]|nr:CBS domain-containing protein [Pseudomonadales bacterium]
MDQMLFEFVRPDFLQVAPDCPLDEVVHMMHAARSSSVLVVEGGEPVGIFTERDAVSLLLESFAGTSWRDLPVKHVMTSPVIAVTDDCTLMEALAVARGGKIRHMPVINSEGKISGLLNQGEMIEQLYKFCMENF